MEDASRNPSPSMSPLLSTAISGRPKSTPVILLQSSAAKSAFPILRSLVNSRSKQSIVLICALYAPDILLPNRRDQFAETSNIHVVNWVANVPGYEEVDWDARLNEAKNTIDLCAF